MNDESRRAFLGNVSVAAGGLAVLGGAVGAASAAQPASGRRITSGSPSPAFSRAVAFGRIVFVAGVVGREPGARGPITTNFESQCRQALKNLQASVEAAGSSMDKVLKCTCFLTNASDFAKFNKIFMSFFPKGPPARSTVVVKELVVPGAALEIDCVTCLE